MKNTLHFRKIQQFFFLSFTMLLLLLSGKGYGQVSITTTGTPLTQNFDGMGATGTTTPTNWFVGTGTTANGTTVVAGTGSANGGGNYNFGSSGSGERALGSLCSSSTLRNTEVRFTNNSGSTIASIIISYDGEQWRLGQTASVDTGLVLQYSANGTTYTAMGSSYNFVPPVTVGTAGPLDGNAGANRVAGIGGTYTPSTPIAPGATFYLRWVDSDNSGSDAGNAVDNFSLTAVAALSAPTVTTTAAVVNSTTSATLAGNVTATNGADITGNGSVYSTTDATPTIDEGATQLATDTPSTGTGAFSKSTGSVLSVNTLYYYNAYAINSQGTGYGTASSFYTLANVPTTPTVDTPTTTSLNVTIGGSDGNPSTTEYAIQANGGNYVQADGSLAAGAVWQTAAAWGTKTVTGLLSSTLYSFAVKARNGANVETAFGTAGTGTTDTVTAANLVLTSGTPAFGSICINTEAKASFTFNGFNLNSTDLTVSSSRADTVITYSLTENGTYSASLTIPNSGTSLSNQIVWVKFAPIEELTLAGDVFSITGGGLDLPFEFSVTGTAVNTVVSGVTTAAATDITALSATFNAGTFVIGCSPVTYGIEYSTSATFTVSQTITDALPYTLSGLEPNTTYYYRAFAIDDVDVAFGDELSFTTAQLAAPNDLPGAPVSYDSFTANWESVDGADEYRLDVSTSPTFSITNPLSNLLITEYGEGSGGNKKYIEIYNGTGQTVDLANYQIWKNANGSNWNFQTDNVTPSIPLSLTGTLANGATYVIANNATDVIGANLYNTFLTFNGDDATGLAWNGGSGTTFTLIDAVGTSGVDPGTGWSVAGTANATVDKILIRKPTVLVGNTNWTASAGTNTTDSEWTVSSFTYNATNQTTDLGLHAVNNVNPSFIIENQSVAGTSYPVTGLEGSTNYYYRVRATSTNSTSANSDVVTVTTDATPPTFGSVAQSGAEEVCDGSEGTFNVTGLLPNSTSTITYNINGGAPQMVTNVVANISGFATFAVTLPASLNGQILTVTQVERTDITSPILTVTANNTASIAVQSRYLFYVDSDGDGYGSTTSSMECSSSALVAPTGFATNDEDCDDTDDTINPGATEVNFNGEDDDCDGSIFNGH
ncbi:hypothetical protein HKT18_13670, partial [Flavobacterium sp. IMCC34852]